MEVKIKRKYKSLIEGKEVELPDFCILTGKNGSGKSHFLESLTQDGIADVKINGHLISVNEISYIGFNGLNPQINPDSSKTSIAQLITNFWISFSQVLNNSKNLNFSSDEQKDSYIKQQLQRYVPDKKLCAMYLTAVVRLSNLLRKNICNLTEDDVRQNIDIAYLESRGTFSGEISAIFKAYWLKYETNQYNIFRNYNYNYNIKTYTETEFFDLFGPKPWDFINRIFKSENLPYEVNNPEGTDSESTFHFELRNTLLGITIQPSDLSTGEKVLMSLAIAIYNSSKKNIKNKVLLIDEPDAALHPEFSKFLLETIKTHIVKDANVKVIITTHSPTTVAMADEECIYEMSKDEKIPKKISQKEALDILCEDIPSLRVSVDKQRIVFVESKYDAENYTKIFEFLQKKRNKDIQPIFHAAYQHSGCSCEDVRKLMSNLESIPGVYGIIDYDNHASDTTNIKVLGYGGELRYTIENYIFDPIFVGLAIIRDELAVLPKTVDYMKFNELEHSEKQALIDYIIDELEMDSEKVNYTTISGEEFSISKKWIQIKGHELETKILNKWPSFNKLKKNGNNGDNAIKEALLNSVIRDYTEYLSSDFDLLFSKIV